MALKYEKVPSKASYKAPAAFSYDPMKDASYKALANVYTIKGDKAAKDTMADAAMLNGGYGTSYATSAAMQARNDYNAELASRIPELEANAYNRYRDTVADRQWQYAQDYQRYRDAKNYNLDVYNTKKLNASGGSGGSSGSGGSGGGYSGGGGVVGTGTGTGNGSDFLKTVYNASDQAARDIKSVVPKNKDKEEKKPKGSKYPTYHTGSFLNGKW